VLLENTELKALYQKLHNAQERVQKIKDMMNTLPTKEKIVALVENR
jgi:hypothetical protein